MALKAAVIMGSDSDWPVVKKTVAQLKAFGIITETHVMSAHRTPQEACTFSENAEKNGFGVIIAAAGMAAHLAGVLAAQILALTDPEVKAALARRKQEMAAAVREKDAKISLEASEI